MKPAKRAQTAANQAGRNPRWRVALLALTAAGCLFRIAHVLATRSNPFFQYLPVDSQAYDLWGQRIAAGDWIGRGVFYQDPLYPYFLGVFYRFFGHRLTTLTLFQALLGSLNVPLIWLLATRLWSPRVGWAAAVLAAIYAPFWFYDGLVLKTFLEVLLLNASLVALLLAVDRPDRNGWIRWGALAGILLGLGTLARANYLGLFLLIVFWLLFLLPEGGRIGGRAVIGSGAERPSGHGASGPGATTEQSAKRARKAGSERGPRSARGPMAGRISARGWTIAVALAAGVAVVLLPVLIRNRVAGGDWVLTTAQGGQNFYIGNNPENKSGIYRAPSFVRPDPQHEQEDFLREAERRAGHPLSPSAASSFWFARALESIRSRPGPALALTVRKLGLLLHRYEVPDNEDFQFWQRYSPWIRLNPVRFGILLPLAFAGLVFGWKARRRLALLYLMLGGYLLSVCLFFVLARYRLPAVSFLIVFAAGAIMEGADAVRARKLRPVLPALVALLAGVVVAHRPIAEETGPMSAAMYTNLSSAYLKEGKVREALEAQRTAVAMAPHWPDALYNLGIALYRSGDRDAAIAEFRRVLELNPNYAESYSYLGNLLEEEGRMDEAVAAQRSAVGLQPGNPVNLFNLGRLLEATGRWNDAAGVVDSLFRLRDPQYDIDGLLLRAQLLARRGDLKSAASDVRTYLSKRPDSPMRDQLESALRAWETPATGAAGR